MFWEDFGEELTLDLSIFKWVKGHDVEEARAEHHPSPL